MPWAYIFNCCNNNIFLRRTHTQFNGSTMRWLDIRGSQLYISSLPPWVALIFRDICVNFWVLITAFEKKKLFFKNFCITVRPRVSKTRSIFNFAYLWPLWRWSRSTWGRTCRCTCLRCLIIFATVWGGCRLTVSVFEEHGKNWSRVGCIRVALLDFFTETPCTNDKHGQYY